MNIRHLATTAPARILPALAALLLVASCGGDSDPVGPGGGMIVIDPPQLAHDGAIPLAPLVVSGPPAGRTDLMLEISPAAALKQDAETMAWPLVAGDDDAYHTVVPLHPVDPLNGGDLVVRVIGENLVSGTTGLTVAGLPPAPGAFAAYLDALQAALDERFTAQGTTREAVLASDWATGLEPALYPLAVAQTLLDDPAHDRDLRDLTGASADWDELLATSERDLDLLDRLVASAGLADLLADETASKGRALSTVIDIGSAAELDAAMEAARWAALEISSESATGQLLQTYGMAAGAVGVLPSAVAKVASAGLGGSIFAYATYREAQSRLLPTMFVPGSLSFDAEPLAYDEDDGTPGSWSNVSVFAQSEGWTLDRTLANLLLQVAGGRDAHGAWLSRLGEATGSVMRDLGGFLAGSGVGRLPADEDGLVQIEPQVWSGIDISGLPWSTARVVGEPAVAITTDQAYAPIAVGTALLTVETAHTRFGGAPTVLERAEITVRAIEVELTASHTSVEPGDSVDIQAVVTNAQDPDLDWSLSAGTWLSPPAHEGGGVWTAVLLTPASPSQFPVQVIAESTAEGGARSQPGAPVRRGMVTINGSEVTVIVEPFDTCLQSGEQQGFVATVLNATDTAVTWSALAPGGGPVGAISAGGTFTAPASPGSYTVVATSVEDPSAQGFATVEVGQCECWWSAQITGTPGGAWSGPFAAHSFPDEFGAFQIVCGTEEDGDPWAVVLIGAEISVGQTGSFPGSWSLGLSDGSHIWIAISGDDDENTWATVTIDENTRARVIGSVSGTALVPIGDAQFAYVPFSMSFRSGSLLAGACEEDD